MEQQPIKFLVVCKDPSASRDLRGMLSALGHDVLAVTDGEQAITLLRADRDIGWVITGIKLGGATDGFGLIEMIRGDSNWSRLPIFVIVDPSMPDMAEKSGDPSFVLLQTLGMTDFLMEPFRQDVLRAKVIITRQRREDVQSD